MKNKKHYNSFHPKHGFFLHLDEVMSWFDAEPSYYETVRFIDKDLVPADPLTYRCRNLRKADMNLS
jgi:aprataxin